MPLFLYIAFYESSFIYGYLFGFFSLFLHLQGVFTAVFQMGQGASFYKLLPFLFNTLYHACFAGLVFWIAQRFILLCKIEKNYFLKIIVSCASLYAFVIYMDLFCLIPFGRCEGYFLMNPLVPLAQCPTLLYLIPSIGKVLTTFLIISIAASASILCIYHRKLALLLIMSVLLLLLFIWRYDFIQMQDTVIPFWHAKIVTLPIAFVPKYNLTFLASSVSDILKTYVKNHQDVEVVIMPESSFYCEVLSMPALSSLWGEKVVGKKVHVLVGAFRWQHHDYFNSMHWVYDGKLQNCFDKKHAMVLTERLPTILQNSFWQKIFFSRQPQITPSKKEKELIRIDDSWSLVPYICSELFFNYFPDDTYHEVPIVAICNDRLLAPYVTRLMFLGAICQAIAWQRTIVYVSFLYQALILSNGKTIPLTRMV
jgi:apolipoprotein N-acyltransferase